MAQLQLRTPCDMSLSILISEVSLRILESIKRELDSIEVPIQSYHQLESGVAAALTRFLSTRSACGTHMICTQGIGAEPLPEIDDRIYLLSLPNGMDELIDSITTKTLDSLVLCLDPEAIEGLKRRVNAGIFRTLSPYLFHNPFCNNHQVCNYSVPVNPWN